MVPQVVSEQFQTNFRLELLLEHPCEDVVEDCKHGRYFLIAERIVFAEGIVHCMEVKFQQLNLRRGFVRRHAENGFQAEDLCKSTTLLCVCLGLFEVLCLVLIELCV